MAGLVMARGRIGGDGRRFNLGEVTVTRAAVRLAAGEARLRLPLRLLAGGDRSERPLDGVAAVGLLPERVEDRGPRPGW
jgi:alpha-D-ribose 1-methylphosphonate 5-triphosphate synthase subunit PhnG